MLVRHGLSKEHVKLKLTKIYEGTTQNVYKSVLLGKVSAGVTLDVDLEKEDRKLQDQFRVILRSGRFAAHPLAVHSRVPKKARTAIAEAVLRIGRTAGSGELLRAVRLTDPRSVDYGKDYRRLEEINEDSLVDGVQAP